MYDDCFEQFSLSFLARCYICRLTQTPDLADRATGEGFFSSSTFPGIEQTLKPFGTGRSESQTLFQNPCEQILNSSHPSKPDFEQNEHYLDPTTPKLDPDHELHKLDSQNETKMDSSRFSEHDSEHKFNDKNNKPAINIVNEMDCDNEVKLDSDSQLNANKKDDSDFESNNKLDSNNPNSLDCLEIKTPFGKSSESSTNSEEMNLKIMEEFEDEDEEEEDDDDNKNMFVGTCILEQSKNAESPFLAECVQIDHDKLNHFKSEEEKLVYEILQSKKGNSSKTTEISVRPKKPGDRLSEEETRNEIDNENENDGGKVKSVSDDEDDHPENPSIKVEEDPEETSDELKMIPSAKSSSKSSLGAFFHQKLFRSPSASSSAPLTSSSSCHSSPETKCVTTDRNRLTVVTDQNRLTAVTDRNRLTVLTDQNRLTVVTDRKRLTDSNQYRSKLIANNNLFVPATLLDACVTLINLLLFPDSTYKN